MYVPLKEAFGDVACECEIAIPVGSAEEAFYGRHIGIVAPLLGLFVAAALPSEAALQIPAVVVDAQLEVGAGHACSVAVVALKHGVAESVGLFKFAECENVGDVGIETLYHKVDLHRAEALIHVGRGAHAVAALLLEVGCKDGDYTFAADDGYVEVFIVGLR